MFCPFCGKEIENQSKFCTYCGKATQIPETAAAPPQVQPPQETAPTDDIPSAPPPVTSGNAQSETKKPKKEKKQKPPKQPSASSAEPADSAKAKTRLKPSIGAALMTAMILLELLPYLLRSVIMLTTKTVLSVPVMCLSIILGYAAMFGSLALMSRLIRGKAAVPAALLFTSVFALRRISEQFIMSLTESDKTLQTVIGYTAEGIVCVLAAFTLSAALEALFSAEDRKHGGKIAATVLVLLSFMVFPVLEAGYYLVPFDHTPSFMSSAFSKLLLAMLEAGCFTLAARAVTGSKAKEKSAAPHGKAVMITGGVCSLVSVVLLAYGSTPQDVLTSVSKDILLPFVQAELFLTSGDMAYAVRFYRLAGEHAKAWSTLAQGGSYTLSSEYPTDTSLRYLSYLNGNGNAMAEYMVNDFDPAEIGFFGPLMLDYYKQRESLSENEEAHRREVIDLCIGADTFDNKYPTMKMIAKHSDDLSNLSEIDSTYAKYLRLAEIFEDIQKNEASVSGSINELLNLAEEYPQD
ncbi:MAG: zinc ribbon domain-containing protein, partial [Oscillospiraceae bacterium]|nr:zinc ribbon domain-containing protein [Oscillospiraceae bacterium]